ncbi:MAG TPA: shikimate kinase [Roseiflexaceae bacterium]|nr:shikimate kinase [Roseiflexaceae bacterium]
MANLQSIALVGLSGVGKSSVGRQLAARLGWPLRDIDALIVQSEGRSIAQIFADAGEARFRDLESAALQQAFSAGACVVATGAGIVLRPENRALLRQRAFVIWLDAPTDILVARLQGHDEARPLVGVADPAARLEAQRAARAALYAEIAHVRLDAAGCQADLIGERVLELFVNATGEPSSFTTP